MSYVTPTFGFLHARLTRIVALCVLLIVLGLVLGACSSPQDTPAETDTEAATSTTTSDSAGVVAQGADLTEWFTGSWAVDFTLANVDPDASWSRTAADQPSAEWKSRIDGYDMVIDAGTHVYSGSFTDGGDGTWTYDGTATYVDEQGIEWTSHIVVTGVKESEDTFTAEQWGEISSSTDGVLYTATWDAAGTRSPE